MAKHFLKRPHGGGSTLQLAGIQSGPAGHPTISCHQGHPDDVQCCYAEFALHGAASLNLSAMCRTEEKESTGLQCLMVHKAG